MWLEENGYVYAGNKFVDEMPLSDIRNKYADHNRLRVFVEKGMVCNCCGRVGTRFLLVEDSGGGQHLDLFTADGVLMTVDHILPQSKGGTWDMYNLDVLCAPCNHEKADRL